MDPDQQPDYRFNSPAASNEHQLPPKRKKFIRARFLLIAALAIVGVVAIIVIASLLFKQHHITYSVKDLRAGRSQNYTFSYPKQWQDASGNSTLVNSIGSGINGFSDIRAYSYSVLVKKQSQLQSFVVYADQPDGISPGLLTQAYRNPGAYPTLTNGFQEIINKFDSSIPACRSISNANSSISYGTAIYEVQINVDYDCTPSSSSVMTSPYHVAAMIGLKGNREYLSLAAARQTDWKYNSLFYRAYLVNSIKP